MGYQQKPGDISVFAEKEKRNDRAPDWKGSMIVPEGAKPGDKLEVAFWAKSETMLAGQAKFPQQRQEQAPTPTSRGPDFDSPF